jgi:TetR/AcrR family transcriptional repressor of nem operon
VTELQGEATRSVGRSAQLVAAASRLFHEQGIDATTIAAVAGAAEIPVGNVYYYFKTKQDLVQAVLQVRTETLRTAIAAIAESRSPRERLQRLVALLLGQREMLARHGCPYGLLGSDLARRGDDDAARGPLSELITWAAAQFEALGRRDAQELAVELIVAYQGSALLAHVLGDPDILTDEAARLERRIDHLAEDGPSSSQPSGAGAQ